MSEDVSSGRRLARATDGTHPEPAPVRLLHLGVGNFFRAHQAYSTHVANWVGSAGERWGYAAFTGRSAGVADRLSSQDGLHTLVVRHADRDERVVVDALSEVHPGSDVTALRRHLASRDLAVVTITVTEAGYVRNADGGLDTADPAVAADIAALASDPLGATPTTAPGRLVAGLLSRRDALGDDAAITICPCDNVPDNGEMVRRVVRDLADAVDPALPAWIDAQVGFVTTMVDRITPRATDADRASLLSTTGVDDPALVVTEPFSEWVISGEFRAGRPAWEAAGVRFVDDVRPYEQRKLWLLNGSHSLMAYAGSILGHETVADAIGDPVVRGWVEEWWDVAARHLTLPADEIAAYRAALLDRYENPRIRHLLAQIAADGSQKLPIRIVPALLAQAAAGGDVTGAARAVAAWVLHLRGHGAPVVDAQADTVTALGRGTLEDSVSAVCDVLGVTDGALVARVLDLARDLTTLSPRPASA